MKICFCVDDINYNEKLKFWTKIALYSCYKNTDLEIYVVTEKNDFDKEMLMFFDIVSAQVIEYKSKIFSKVSSSVPIDILLNQFHNFVQFKYFWKNCIYNKIEIPAIFTKDDIILFADVDVVFTENFKTEDIYKLPVTEIGGHYSILGPLNDNDIAREMKCINAGFIIYNVENIVERIKDFDIFFDEISEYMINYVTKVPLDKIKIDNFLEEYLMTRYYNTLFIDNIFNSRAFNEVPSNSCVIHYQANSKDYDSREINLFYRNGKQVKKYKSEIDYITMRLGKIYAIC